MPGRRPWPMGIGIQNFPEGAAVALPLRQGGWSRPRAFVGGMLSGAVEPVFGVLAALAAAGVDPLMPWLLSFAAGAMLYVVVEELIPQAHSRAGTCGFVMGFLVMMVLDVALAAETALWTPAKKGREAACRRSPGLAQLRPLCWAAEPESPEWLRRPER